MIAGHLLGGCAVLQLSGGPARLPHSSGVQWGMHSGSLASARVPCLPFLASISARVPWLPFLALISVVFLSFLFFYNSSRPLVIRPNVYHQSKDNHCTNYFYYTHANIIQFDHASGSWVMNGLHISHKSIGSWYIGSTSWGFNSIGIAEHPIKNNNGMRIYNPHINPTTLRYCRWPFSVISYTT